MIKRRWMVMAITLCAGACERPPRRAHTPPILQRADGGAAARVADAGPVADAGNWQDAETGDAGLDDDDWQPPDDPADPLHWVGVWHECPDVGAGYCARLALFKDGHFESVGGQETCGPELLSSRGTWTLARGALVFSESFRTEWVGGHCKEEGDEMETVGGFKRTINRAKPLVTRVPIRACNKAQAESGGDTLECVRMGAKPRWHKSSNPSDINQD